MPNPNVHMNNEKNNSRLRGRLPLRREGLFSGSRVGTSCFTVGVPLPVTFHIVHSDVADVTERGVLFLEHDCRVAGDLHSEPSERAFGARELGDVLDSPTVHRPALY
jgi:hypothetical protein